MRVLYSVSNNKKWKSPWLIHQGFFFFPFLYLQCHNSNYISLTTDYSIKNMSGIEYLYQLKKNAIYKTLGWTELMACAHECSVRWNAKSPCHYEPKLIKWSQFLPDFLLPLANFLIKIISVPQRLRLNSLLECGFMLIADAGLACWTDKKTNKKKKRNLFFISFFDMEFQLWVISNFKNVAPAEAKETLAASV